MGLLGSYGCRSSVDVRDTSVTSVVIPSGPVSGTSVLRAVATKSDSFCEYQLKQFMSHFKSWANCREEEDYLAWSYLTERDLLSGTSSDCIRWHATWGSGRSVPVQCILLAADVLFSRHGFTDFLLTLLNSSSALYNRHIRCVYL